MTFRRIVLDDDWIVEILNESHKRHYDEDFSDDDEEDIQYSGAIQPMLDFELRHVGVCCNWKHMLIKQRYKDTLTQHQDVTSADNLRQELMQALRRATDRGRPHPDARLHHPFHFAV